MRACLPFIIFVCEDKKLNLIKESLHSFHMSIYDVRYTLHKVYSAVYTYMFQAGVKKKLICLTGRGE